jgi:type II secretory pathway pseudopilin PulG
MKNRANNQRGSTLVDVILTTAILGIALFGGMLAMQTATAHAVDNDLSSIATQLANEKIEEIMMDAQTQGYDYVSNDNYSSETIADHYNMTRTVAIVEVDEDDLSTASEGSGLKTVEVTVSWGVGSYETVTLTTMVAE